MIKKISLILPLFLLPILVACSQPVQKPLESYRAINPRLEFFRDINPKDAPTGPDTVIKLEMSEPESYNWYGITAADEERDYQKAIDNFNEAIKLDPLYATAYGNRGIVYSKLGEYQKAIEDYNKAIEIYPNYTKAYFNRGSTYVKLEDYQQALKDYNKAIALNPEDPYIYVLRAFIYSHLGDIKKECADHIKACELGRCAGLNIAQQKGLCQNSVENGL